MKSFDPTIPAERTKIVAIIGSEQDLYSVTRELGAKLSQLFGGCYLSSGMGYWSDEGNQQQTSYPINSIAEENSLKVELLIMPDQQEEALFHLHSLLKNVNKEHSLNSRFIHVEISPAKAAHLDLAL